MGRGIEPEKMSLRKLWDIHVCNGEIGIVISNTSDYDREYMNFRETQEFIRDLQASLFIAANQLRKKGEEK